MALSLFKNIYDGLTSCYSLRNFCKDEYLSPRDEFVRWSKLRLKDRAVINGSAAFDYIMKDKFMFKDF